MINVILKGIMKLVIGLVSVLLKPIDLVILQFLPDLSNALSAIGDFLRMAGDGIGFAISLTGLSSETLSLIALYFTFKLTAPILISSLKSAIKWYDKIKP